MLHIVYVTFLIH